MKITTYENIKSPRVKSIIDIEQFITTIKNGDDNKILIESARQYGKGHTKYDIIKTTLLPTYRFNFLFEESASNKNITGPTGLIYLDVDEKITIPNNEYIFAKWESLSTNGYGILVRVDNLTIDNFKSVYTELSNILGIDTDTQAAKATQQTVLSYDENIYYNPNSLVYHYTESKKVSFPRKKEKEECMGRDDTFLEYSSPIRFNNIDDYFIDNPDKPYIVFKDEKVKICDPFIPFRVEKGKRNTTMYYCLSQYAMLNTYASYKFLMSCAITFNLYMYPRLQESELSSIVNSIVKKKEDGTLVMYYNKERRLLFNPFVKVSHKEKMKVVNKELGHMKSEKTKETIYAVIEAWNFESLGKITQTKICGEIDVSLSTVKRHWKHFKSYIDELNSDYKAMQDKSIKMGYTALFNLSNDAIEWAIIPNKIQEKVMSQDIRNNEIISKSA